MSSNDTARSEKNLHREVQGIWDQNAIWWDGKVGDGNDFQRLLIGPATERLLDLHPGEDVLDCACGNGMFSRRMAQLGARVVAFDFSENFLERARARSTEYIDRIDYRLIDASNETQVMALGERRFDAAVCTMALMDMASIDSFIQALSRLLKPGGRFVFSVLHPCFNNPDGCRMVAEEEDREGELAATYSIKVLRYSQPSTAKGVGIVGQPVPHYYFHRPISMLFSTCFRAGFLLDGMEEPVFDLQSQPERAFSWANFREIPPVLVARMNLAK